MHQTWRRGFPFIFSPASPVSLPLMPNSFTFSWLKNIPYLSKHVDIKVKEYKLLIALTAALFSVPESHFSLKQFWETKTEADKYNSAISQCRDQRCPKRGRENSCNCIFNQLLWKIWIRIWVWFFYRTKKIENVWSVFAHFCCRKTHESFRKHLFSILARKN